MLSGDVISPEWSQRALWAMRETLDVDADLKGQMVDFLLATRLWAIELEKRPANRAEEDLAIRSAALHRFSRCLNPNQPERFTWQVIMALCSRFQRPGLLQFMAEDMGYELRRLTSDERLQAAFERLAEAEERSNALREREIQVLESLGAKSRLMKIHPAIRAGTASFCKSADEPDPKVSY
jgi:hypothetical protein